MDKQNQSPEKIFRAEYFLVVVDMASTSLANRFEALETFQNIFGFLFDSNKLKSLDENELRKRCVTFNSTFSYGDSLDVNLKNLYSELKVLQSSLPNNVMLATEIFEFVKSADCILNISHNPGDCGISRKKFFKIKINQNLFEVINVTRMIE